MAPRARERLTKMLELAIATREELALPEVDRTAAPERWRDEDGIVFAYGHSSNGTHWLDVPDVGVFRFGADEARILVVPEPSASRAALFEAYRRLVLPNALQALGTEVLHGSAVLACRGVVALCGKSRTGKSTAAFALSRRGYPLWADDAVAFDDVGGVVRALPLPFAIQLRQASASFFGFEAKVHRAAPVAEADEPARLSVIVLLDREGSRAPDVHMRRLPPHEAFVALLPNAYWFTLADQRRKRLMIDHYLDLSKTVPVFDLRFRPGFERLDAVLDSIETAMEEANDG